MYIIPAVKKTKTLMDFSLDFAKSDIKFVISTLGTVCMNFFATRGRKALLKFRWGENWDFRWGGKLHLIMFRC